MVTYEELQMKVHTYIQERQELIREVRRINDEPYSAGQSKRLAIRMDRIKILNNRISTMGKRYNIVRVWGKYVIISGNIQAGKDFQIYYTDISTQDARTLAEMTFENGVHEVHAEVVPVGVVMKQEFQVKK